MTENLGKLYVLDTSVLLHDPYSLFSFEEHDICLPISVVEGLDAAKKGISEIARNARQASRLLDQIIHEAGGDINGGLALANPLGGAPGGQLRFITDPVGATLPAGLHLERGDNLLLATVIDLTQRHADAEVILVSKNINTRIKANALGLRAEDYTSDQVIDDANILHSGMRPLEPDFWERHGEALESWTEGERTFYRVHGEDFRNWLPNSFLYADTDTGFDAVVRRIETNAVVIEKVHDYSSERHNVWGITARNREQNFALNLLTDPEIDFVSLIGQAGTGKTLLTLAAALNQTLDEKRYSEILVTRMTVPVGEDIGFLPGTEEEKMNPWMGALEDNLDVLLPSPEKDKGSWGRAATHDLVRNRIRIKSLNFMRGRTFLNKFVIIDEAQNLTPHQMKTLVTRAGTGSKVVCLGNIAQIDTPYLTETTSGLTYVVDRFKSWEHSGHVTLRRVERSRLADYASDTL